MMRLPGGAPLRTLGRRWHRRTLGPATRLLAAAAATGATGGPVPPGSGSREWRLWDRLDLRDEVEKVRLAAFLDELVTERAAHPPGGGGGGGGGSGDLSGATAGLEVLSVAVDDTTLHLPPTLTPEAVADLLAFFLSGGRLHERYVRQILTQAVAILNRSPRVAVLPAPSPLHPIVIVGDLHGSLDSLATILDAVGLPGPQRCFVFNGDFVDRGRHGVEVLLLLLAWKVALPAAVHLNRGNHEDALVATAYDFRGEVEAKYPMAAAALFDAFADLFARLPYAAVIPAYAFVVHGGLARRDFAIDDLLALTGTHNAQSVVTAGAAADPTLSLLQDLVWSDPRPGRKGTRPNTARNAGCFYGGDVIREWLKRHGLRYLVRSHQCVPEGWQCDPTGDGTAVYTVFSAAQYPDGVGANLGAVLRVTGVDREPEALPFAVPTVTAAEDQDAATRQSLVALICRHKHPLQAAFQAATATAAAAAPGADPDLLGVDQWAAILTAELGLELDWRSLQPLLGGATGRYDAATQSLQPAALVNWRKFLSAFHVEFKRFGGKSAITGPIVTALYAHHAQLALVFRVLDADGDGTLTREELRAGCALLAARLPPGGGGTPLDGDQLFALMDLDGSGAVSLNEFCEAFRISHAP